MANGGGVSVDGLGGAAGVADVLDLQREVAGAAIDEDDQTATLLEMFPGPRISARTLLLQESGVLWIPSSMEGCR